MMHIGFIGLGNLGKAMAERLMSQGEELVVWNRTRTRAEGLKADIADSPADVAAKTDTIFLNLFDSPAVSEVLSGDGGLLKGDLKKKLVIDTTTNHFEAVPLFYDLVRKSGGEYLEAPIFGSVVPASKGALTIVASGTRQAFDRGKPLLDKLASTIFHIEQPTMATRMKLVNNMVLGGFMAVIAESAAYGEAAGIPRDQVLDILGAAAGNSAILNAKKQKLIDDDYSSHFSVNAIYKDLQYAGDLAEELKKPLFMAGMARELFALARAAGREEDDFSAIYGVYREFARQ